MYDFEYWVLTRNESIMLFLATSLKHLYGLLAGITAGNCFKIMSVDRQIL